MAHYKWPNQTKTQTCLTICARIYTCFTLLQQVLILLRGRKCVSTSEDISFSQQIPGEHSTIHPISQTNPPNDVTTCRNAQIKHVRCTRIHSRCTVLQQVLISLRGQMYFYGYTWPLGQLPDDQLRTMSYSICEDSYAFHCVMA